MSQRIRIVVSRLSHSQQAARGDGLSTTARLKLILSGILLASLATVVLSVVLVLSTVTLVLLWVALMAIVVTLILKAATRRADR